MSPEQLSNISGLLLWRLFKSWQAERRRLLTPLGLGHTEFVLLAHAQWLALRERPLTQRELAEAVGVDVMTASQAARSLERKGCLARLRSDADRRTRQLKLTPKGRTLAKRGVREVEDLNRRFFLVLGDDESQFVRLMNRLLAAHPPAWKEERLT
jgi:DNA-binding MarR family transcriptional regulator